ncbi:MAG: hypothetical protein M3161_07450 [Actinomycetota bacterium]|nr:hypothetical protein [Actinomycetota bacterium]
MSTRDLEIELRRWRGDNEAPRSNALELSIGDALAFRNAGNLPDELGRTLRLVLHVNDPRDLTYLQDTRLRFEPDFHDAPRWRRTGSRPVNVVPLRAAAATGTDMDAWWDDEAVRTLEEEWSRTGRVAGVGVPAEYRAFVYKTVLSLRAAGRDVSKDAIVSSIARWLDADDVARIAEALDG